jgi:hypothetical protein
MYMNDQVAASEAEIRAVLAEGADDADPLRPLGLCLLGQAVYNGGRFQEFGQLARESEDSARRGGPDGDYDLAEALFNRCALAVFRGTPDRAAANEYLQLARALGNARALAGALIASGLSEPDPRRGEELLAQARELTAQSKDTYRHLVATMFVELLADDRDPLRAIRGLAEFVEQVRSTGLRVLLRQKALILLRAMATIGRYDAVAVLDGAHPHQSIRPAQLAQAVTAAREALGEDRYAELSDIGRSFSPSDLEEFLLQLASEVSESIT